MIGPTTITTPEGVTLRIPMAWTVWTCGIWRFTRTRSGAIEMQCAGLGRTPAKYWNGRGWDHVAAGRFLEVV